MPIFQTDFEVIEQLDLDPIKVKLMHRESGEGWTLEQANEVEFEYKRFLYLMKNFAAEGAAPRTDVDIFWHYHILDTLKYARDCQAVFGYFLHHFPYVGLRGDDDLKLHHRAGERMHELYEQTFGEALQPSVISRKATHPRMVGQTAYSYVPGADAISLSIDRATYSSVNGSPAAASASRMDIAYSFTPPPGVDTAYSYTPPSADTAYSFTPSGADRDENRPMLGYSTLRPSLAAARAHC
jgi:hypothetical protein